MGFEIDEDLVRLLKLLEEPYVGLPAQWKSLEGCEEEMAEATKLDEGKAPLSLIPREALIAEAQVLGFGAKKYGRDNWRKGMDWTRLTDAALRHITAWSNGEDVDEETGLSHLAHAKCCLSFLLTYQERGLGNDDRAVKTGSEEQDGLDSVCLTCIYSHCAHHYSCDTCHEHSNYASKGN